MRMFLPFILLLACSDAYDEAKQLNTIDAYEKFLKENPTHPRKFEANMGLETLYIEKARKTNDINDYDAYLKRFNGSTSSEKKYSEVSNERKDLAWELAKKSNDTAQINEFIEKYKASDSKATRVAKQYLKVAKYSESLTMTPVVQEQVNLATDPSGPPNGWQFSAEVTNNGVESIKNLTAKINFYDLDGNIIESKISTVIGIGEYKGREWLFDDKESLERNPELRRIKSPMKPNEKREWVFSTGDVPAEWGKKVTVEFSGITFVK